MTNSAQTREVLLALCSEITPVGAQETICDEEIEPGSAVCTASTYPTILSWPTLFFKPLCPQQCSSDPVDMSLPIFCSVTLTCLLFPVEITTQLLFTYLFEFWGHPWLCSGLISALAIRVTPGRPSGTFCGAKDWHTGWQHTEQVP